MTSEQDDDGYIGYPNVQSASARMMRWQMWKQNVTQQERIEASVELALDIAQQMDDMKVLLGRHR